MQTIYIKKGDPRLGELTPEGQYRWPGVNVAFNGYQVPNVEPYYIGEPDDRGGRVFVVRCEGFFDAAFVVGEEPQLEPLAFDPALPDHDKTVVTVSDSNGIVETHVIETPAADTAVIEKPKRTRKAK